MSRPVPVLFDDLLAQARGCPPTECGGGLAQTQAVDQLARTFLDLPKGTHAAGLAHLRRDIDPDAGARFFRHPHIADRLWALIVDATPHPDGMDVRTCITQVEAGGWRTYPDDVRVAFVRGAVDAGVVRHPQDLLLPILRPQNLGSVGDTMADVDDLVGRISRQQAYAGVINDFTATAIVVACTMRDLDTKYPPGHKLMTLAALLGRHVGWAKTLGDAAMLEHNRHTAALIQTQTQIGMREGWEDHVRHLVDAVAEHAPNLAAAVVGRIMGAVDKAIQRPSLHRVPFVEQQAAVVAMFVDRDLVTAEGLLALENGEDNPPLAAGDITLHAGLAPFLRAAFPTSVAVHMALDRAETRQALTMALKTSGTMAPAKKM